MTLRTILERSCRALDLPFRDLTVLTTAKDPYRLDTPAGHRNGKWLAEQLDRLLGSTSRVHLRGLHYAIVADGHVLKPNGKVYVNDDDNWTWLSETAGKAARWLRYIPFDRIVDHRNAAPIIHRRASMTPDRWITAGINVDVPALGDITPRAAVSGFVARQAYHFVIFGEKSSLEDIADPIAQEFEADLYLPTGEISDTLIYQIATDAAADGRPLVLFTLSDCDPSGHQMLVSIGRKLQAFRDLFFPDLEFEVVPIALTPSQVRELGLPETPLKEEEKRASRWREAFGVDQTEIDALTTPTRAPILREIIRQAFKPYNDTTLQRRVTLAEVEWRRAAQAALDDRIDGEHLAAIRASASLMLSQFREGINSINDDMQRLVDGVTLPPVVVPQPGLALDSDRPSVVSFDHDWIAASRALKARKSYGSAA
jgi:hypothetical protein